MAEAVNSNVSEDRNDNSIVASESDYLNYDQEDEDELEIFNNED